MSFDVFLVRFQNGESADVPRQPVQAVLKANTYQRPDNHGFYYVTFPDGTGVEFSASGLESEEDFKDCAFHIRGFGDHLMDCILQVAKAGDMVIIPAMEDNALILTSAEQERHLPADLRESLRPVMVNSPAELGELLRGGFEGWSAYRDHVVNRAQP